LIEVDLGEQRACHGPCTRTKPDCQTSPFGLGTQAGAFARKGEQNTERFSSLAAKKRVGTEKNLSHPYGKIRADFAVLRQPLQKRAGAIFIAP